ncbi:MAG TPA: hypothetical protein VMJ92_00165 [Candidatus Limnocylindrales bacterium]|nr:hypothetical protein [Candidatus Limnocylindrales bacterium]
MAATMAVRPRTARRDLWWLEPLAIVVVLGAFVLYSAWAGLQNANYYVAPYLSPFYSPCIAAICEHVTFGPLVGQWYGFSPAALILALPLGFRLTCYYYRRSYYRAFFWAPPACTVQDARKRYSGETLFPLILQNVHRYFFYGAIFILAVLTYDAILAFSFPEGFGIGLGTVVMWVNVVLLALYTFGCHSGRYLCGGHVDRFHEAPLRHRLWSAANRLNARHGLYAWLSLFSVGLTDVYIRLLAMGVITDPRLL